jgi:RNA polymerase sigma-70 factor (ECF subfamily)
MNAPAFHFPVLHCPQADAVCMNASRDESDCSVVARCQEGEREAFEILLRRYRDRTFNLALSLLDSRDDAEDATQEAFTQAFGSIGSFRGQSQFWTWLYRIALNICLHRKRRAKPCESLDDAKGDENDTGASDARDAVEAKMMVESTLRTLPETLRVVLILREMHDLSYEEIASVLGIPIGTVRSRLSAARAQFKKAWHAET